MSAERLYGMKYELCGNWIACVLLGYCIRETTQGIDNAAKECRFFHKLATKSLTGELEALEAQVNELPEATINQAMLLYNEEVCNYFNQKYRSSNIT